MVSNVIMAPSRFTFLQSIFHNGRL
jgi:hypothetical protein